MKRVLIACEESQVVTKAFRRLGIDAFSCDVVDCSGGHPEWHLKEDVLPLLFQSWDLIIAFPPSTHLAASGSRWFKQKRLDGRQNEGIEFFMQFTYANTPRLAIENPVGVMSSAYRKPDQIINPFQFGDAVAKKTCLWLKNLPKLEATDEIDENRIMTKFFPSSGKIMTEWYYQTSCLPHKERAKARSKTFQGIADAMAEQWGPLL